MWPVTVESMAEELHALRARAAEVAGPPPPPPTSVSFDIAREVMGDTAYLGLFSENASMVFEAPFGFWVGLSH